MRERTVRFVPTSIAQFVLRLTVNSKLKIMPGKLKSLLFNSNSLSYIFTLDFYYKIHSTVLLLTAGLSLVQF